MSILPNKPSDLISVALSDLRKVESDEWYAVRMGVWHEPQERACAVCFAGAVMAMTLHVPINTATNPDEFKWALRRKLRALDAFRRGELYEAYSALGILRPPGIPHAVPIPDYGRYSEAFHAAMHGMADMLEKAGDYR